MGQLQVGQTGKRLLAGAGADEAGELAPTKFGDGVVEGFRHFRGRSSLFRIACV